MPKLILLFILSFLAINLKAQSVSITASTNAPCVGQSVTFTATVSPANTNVSSYNWDFGDGTTGSTVTNTTTHSFSAAGSRTITVSMTIGGITGVNIGTVVLSVKANPTAAFTVAPQGCSLPVAVAFTNTSLPASGMTYSWSFPSGNASSSTSQTPANVNYSAAGAYNATLSVTETATGCTATVTNPLTISVFTTDFAPPLTICKGASAQFTDQSTTGANEWTWSSGAGQNSTLQNPTFTYNNAGTFTVTLTSKNTNAGCTGTKTRTITVLDLPTVNFTATPVTGCSPLNVTFTNTSQPGGTCSWSFGDATTSTSTSPSHTYTTSSPNLAYDVTLTVTGTNGCVNSLTMNDYIKIVTPIAGFSIVPKSGCEPLNVVITNASNSPLPITGYAWDFGNGTTASTVGPHNKTYALGKYAVKLVITTQGGCTATFTDTVKVGKVFPLQFTNPASLCAHSGSAQFVSQVTGATPLELSECSYEWNFGDGGTKAEANPNYSYPDSIGTFDVKLKVTYRGCVSEITKNQVITSNAAIAKFTVPQTYCHLALPQTVNVTDKSKKGTVDHDVVMTWYWRDASNATTIITNAQLDAASGNGSTSFSYPNYGVYTITQKIVDNTTGCIDSMQQTINITDVTPSFSDFSNFNYCDKSPVVFTNTTTNLHSQPAGSTIINTRYTIQGSVTNQPINTPLSHVFSHAAANFPVTLEVTNSFNCAVSVTKNIEVFALPVPEITTADFVGCAPKTVTYQNTSYHQDNGHPTMASFVWTKPDGTTDTSSDPLSINYTTEGNFEVKIQVTDGRGCVSPTASVFMEITKPTPQFTIDPVICTGVQFSAINGSFGAGVLNSKWYIDGIQKGTSANLTETITDVTTTQNHVDHVVRLVVEDENHCVNELEKTISISTPHANLTKALSGFNLSSNGHATCPPVEGIFTDISNVMGPHETFWTFGNGNTSTITPAKTNYYFAGQYSCKLVIKDSYGCLDTLKFPDFLTIGGPSIESIISETIDICDNAYVFDTINSKNVKSFTWDFGDGTVISSGLETVHNYTTQGTYHTKLIVVDDQNCAIPYEKDVVVLFSDIHAQFEAQPSVGYIGNDIIFIDQSTAGNAPITEWTWSFEDVENSKIVNSSGANVAFNYGLPNIYNVTLIVKNANNCTDTTVVPVHIKGDIDVPNIFTPNGDGVNDIMEFPLNIFNYFNVTVVNRWGNLIFDSKNVKGTKIWDAKDSNNEYVMDGVYFYKITGEFKDGTEFMKEGFFTIATGK